MKKDNQKQLIDDLIQFMRSGNRKTIAIADYIKLTNSRKKWTDKQINELYRALDRTQALSVSSSQHEKPMKVRDVETQKIRSITVTYTRIEAMLLV